MESSCSKVGCCPYSMACNSRGMLSMRCSLAFRSNRCIAKVTALKHIISVFDLPTNGLQQITASQDCYIAFQHIDADQEVVAANPNSSKCLTP